MRNTSDTHTTRTDLEFRNRRRSLDRLEGRHASRGLRSNFRFGIFGSIRNPFPRSRRALRSYASAGIPFVLSLRSPRPVTLVRSGTPRIQFYCSYSSVTETRARARGADAGRSGEGGGREADFQMDINSSASSTPRSSLITPLQLLSLIKAGCRWVLRQAAARTRETRRGRTGKRNRRDGRTGSETKRARTHLYKFNRGSATTNGPGGPGKQSCPDAAPETGLERICSVRVDTLVWYFARCIPRDLPR